MTPFYVVENNNESIKIRPFAESYAVARFPSAHTVEIAEQLILSMSQLQRAELFLRLGVFKDDATPTSEIQGVLF